MSDMPPPPPDDSGWSSDPPPPPGPPSYSPHAVTGWATIGTGERVELASLGARLGARIIDWVILGVVGIVLFVVLIVSFSPYWYYNYSPAEERANKDRVVVLFVSASSAIIMLYEVALIASRGQTLGKMATRIRVVRADNGVVPGWGKSFGRWLVPAGAFIAGTFISAFIARTMLLAGLVVLLIYVSLLWDKRRQGWHDKAAATLVVKV